MSDAGIYGAAAAAMGEQERARRAAAEAQRRADRVRAAYHAEIRDVARHVGEVDFVERLLEAFPDITPDEARNAIRRARGDTTAPTGTAERFPDAVLRALKGLGRQDGAPAAASSAGGVGGDVDPDVALRAFRGLRS